MDDLATDCVKIFEAAVFHCHLLLYNKLMPWDHAAGWLIHQEAGGYSAHFDGSAYRPAHLRGYRRGLRMRRSIR
jgi:fructose-1,6-bisphosphatase/inositol monophosphatase family enzyme